MALTVEELQIKLGCDASQAQEVLDKMNATVKAYTDKFQKYFQTKSGNVKPLSTVAKQIDKEAKNIKSANKRLSKASRDTDMMLARIRSAVNRNGTEYFPSGKKYVGGDANGRGGPGSMGDHNYFKNSEAYKMTFGGRKPNNKLIEYGAQLRATIEDSLASVNSLSEAMKMKIGDALVKLRDLSKQYQDAVREHGKGSPQANAAEQKFKNAIYAADGYLQKLDRVAAKEQAARADAKAAAAAAEEEDYAKDKALLSGIFAKAEAIGDAMKRVRGHIKKAFDSTLLGKFLKRLGTVMLRMAAMKLIRGTIQGVQKGLEELAKHSASSAKAMNTFKAAGGSIKMALGAAVMPLVKALAPLFVQLAGAISSAANAVARFFAVITGQSTYTAVTFSSSLDGISSSATGAGKAVKGMLASFDEINLITSQSGGGGGGSSGVESTLSTVGDQLAFSSLASRLREQILGGDWHGVGVTLQESLAGLNTKFSEWLENLKELKIGEKLAELINGFFSPDENGEFPAFKDLGKNLGDLLATIGTQLVSLILDVKWEDVAGAFVAFVQGFWEGITEAWEKWKEERENEGKPTALPGFQEEGWVGSDTGDPTASLGGEMLTPDEMAQWWRDYKDQVRKKLGIPEGQSILWSILTGDSNLFDGLITSLEGFDTKVNTWVSNLNISETIDVGVGLVKKGWTTVSEWVSKYGKSPAEALVKLAKKGWTTVSEWVKKYGGAAYSKAVQLAKSGWTTVSAWVSKYVGGTVSKGVSLLKSGWTTVSGWVQTYIGGTVSKAISLTVNLLGTAWQKFLDAWNGLKNKTLELKIGIADRIRSAWNTAAGKWNSSTILSALGKLPYLASGGIAYGQTAAIIGEYAGARSNPEVVAPLSELTRILSNAKVGSGDTMTKEQANTMIRLLQRIEQKENVIQPSVGLGQVVDRSLDMYART